MANEIRGVAPTGSTLYARIINRAGQWWQGAIFENYASVDYASYVIPLTEQGASGVFVADFPAGITTAGVYEYYVHLQSGGSPAEGDAVTVAGRIEWSGTASVQANADAMAGSDWRDYVLRRGFKRDDKDQELYEATTDAVQEMRRRFGFDEAKADVVSTDSISVLGDYKLTNQADMGLLQGIILQDDQIGTPLNKINKARFDELYPYAAADTAFRGYPRDFCVYGGQIYIGPTPDRTSYTYRLSYSKRGGVVTSATVGVPFTDLYRDVLCDLVMSYLYDALEEFDKANMYRQKFESGFNYIKRRERDNAGEGTFMMKPADC